MDETDKEIEIIEVLDNMDRREQERLAILGSTGIIAESFKLFWAHAGILIMLQGTLMVPNWMLLYASQYLVFQYFLVVPPLQAVDTVYVDFERETQEVGRHVRMLKQLGSSFDTVEVLAFYSAFWLISLAISLVSFAAIVYTAGCIYTGLSISYTQVMMSVPKLWKRLMVTGFIALLVANGGLLVYIILFLLLAVLSNFIPEWLVTPVVLSWVASMIILVGLLFYFSMVWQVAKGVASVEGIYGWAAVKRSSQLIKGKRCVSFRVNLLYSLLSAILYSKTAQAFMREDVGERLLGSVVYVFLCMCWTLLSNLSAVVMFLSCKATHHESIHSYCFLSEERLQELYEHLPSEP